MASILRFQAIGETESGARHSSSPCSKFTLARAGATPINLPPPAPKAVHPRSRGRDPLVSGKLSPRFSHKFAEIRSLNLDARYWEYGRRMRRGAIEWTFIGWNEMRA